MTLSIPGSFPPPPAPEVQPQPPVATSADPHASASTGSTRQNEDSQVHQLKALGRTPTQIAVELSIPPATVNTDLFIGIPKMLSAPGTGEPSTSGHIISLTA